MPENGEDAPAYDNCSQLSRGKLGKNLKDQSGETLRIKSEADVYWDMRADSLKDDREVNCADMYQRNLELSMIRSYLRDDMMVLEVGCGNGYSTSVIRESVKHVDAFDRSDRMIQRASRSFGETNNRFFVDDILDPHHVGGSYDLVLCVRVLINLPDLTQQRIALGNITSLVRSGGMFVLVEGFGDGFIALNGLRRGVGMPPLEPASVNCYSLIDELKPPLERDFDVQAEFHLGSYDYLTRFVYPYIVGPENVKHNTELHDRFRQLASAFNPDFLKEFSRARGFVMVKKDESQ